MAYLHLTRCMMACGSGGSVVIFLRTVPNHNSLQRAEWCLPQHHYSRLEPNDGLLRWLLVGLPGLGEVVLTELVSFEIATISLHSLKTSLFWVGRADTPTFRVEALCHHWEWMLFFPAEKDNRDFIVSFRESLLPSLFQKNSQCWLLHITCGRLVEQPVSLGLKLDRLYEAGFLDGSSLSL